MKNKLPIIVLFVLISTCVTIFTLKNTKTADKNYIKVDAIITNVYPSKISKYGLKPAKYDIRFLDKNGKEQELFRLELGSNYQEDDIVPIIYNPKNRNDVKLATSNNEFKSKE